LSLRPNHPRWFGGFLLRLQAEAQGKQDRRHGNKAFEADLLAVSVLI
jgi:hypothetical protein